MRHRLKCTPIPGELGRFYVDSQRAEVGPYLVDLFELDCNGACGCEHFEFRLRPLAEAQLNTKNIHARMPVVCIHLIDAREYFLQTILHQMKNQPPLAPVEYTKAG